MPRLHPIAKQLKSDITFWAKELRLQDWILSLYLGGDTSVRGRTTAACISIDPYHKSAEIRVGMEEGYDPEECLVHELLHLHLEGWQVEDESADELLKEQSVNILARTLVGLRRATKKE